MTARPPRACSIAIALLVSIVSGSAMARESSGAQLASICAACHRLEGHDLGLPPIVGLPPNDLVSAMWVFKSDERSNRIMHAVSVSLSDEDIAAIASYLAGLRPSAEP